MITLITYQAGFGQPSLSPFCVKAMWLLQAAGVDWQREDSNDPRKMPYAKLPAIRTAQGIIADSHDIQTHLEEQGAQFWGVAADRVLGHALIRMAEEHMYFHILMDRWGDDDVWPIIRDTYFDAIPGLLRKPITSSIRKAVMKGMHTQGLGRFDRIARMERIEPDLMAIATLLRDQPYLLGDTINLPDYPVAAMLSAAMAGPLPTALRERVSDDPVLSDYAARMTQEMGL
ncbi:glutathione S-transferase family protein [Loktanella agnita]|uniref:glutathione S-transferase family protein n=1 Tax=Loktanella agnita TaxID=287097 RepID=UPI0039862CBD